MHSWLRAAATAVGTSVAADWHVADVATKGGATPMRIWAIELVKVLELAALVFPEVEDSVRAWD